VRIRPERVRTNIVQFELEPAAGISATELARRLHEERRIGLGTYPPDQLRALTHYWVGPAEIRSLVEALRGILAPAGERAAP
jgi:hypothetical protein